MCESMLVSVCVCVIVCVLVSACVCVCVNVSVYLQQAGWQSGRHESKQTDIQTGRQGGI